MLPPNQINNLSNALHDYKMQRAKKSPQRYHRLRNENLLFPQATTTHNSPAKELTLRPAVAPASVCKAPREAMGLTEELLLELGEEPAIKIKQLNFNQYFLILITQFLH